MRLDNYLYSNNLTVSRSKAKNLIEMGFVSVNGKIIKKSGFEVKDSDKITVLQDNFASVGSFKLQKALSEFNLCVENLVCLDVGASNGGFTEVLIKANANKVYALDVGECALPDYLKNDGKVIIKDKINARYASFEDIGEKVDLIVIDVSFISLKLIIPNIKQFLKENGYIIALIKPQFEGKKTDLNKKGIVKSVQKIQSIVNDISEFCQQIGFKVIDKVQTPLLFQDKNIEWLIFMQTC